MKKLISCLLIIGVFVLPLQARRRWIPPVVSGATEHLWTTPILQQQTLATDNYVIGTDGGGHTDCSQFVHNTDSSSRLITKMGLKLNNISGGSGTLTITLSSGIDGSGTVYGTMSGTVADGDHSSAFSYFTGSITIAASTSFYLTVTCNVDYMRVYQSATAGGTLYENTTYCCGKFSANIDPNNDLAFEIYITS